MKKFLTVMAAAVVLAVTGSIAFAAYDPTPKATLCVATKNLYVSGVKVPVGNVRWPNSTGSCASGEVKKAVAAFVAPTTITWEAQTNAAYDSAKAVGADLPEGKTINVTSATWDDSQFTAGGCDYEAGPYETDGADFFMVYNGGSSKQRLATGNSHVIPADAHLEFQAVCTSVEGAIVPDTYGVLKYNLS